eukprot:7274411-Prymnesium_polylepis.1
MLLQRQRAAPLLSRVCSCRAPALPYASQAGIPRYLNGFQKIQQPQKAGSAKIAVFRHHR